MDKRITSWQTEKKNLTAKRKTSRQKVKLHGKKNNLTAKRTTSQQKEKDSRQNESFSFCREVNVLLP